MNFLEIFTISFLAFAVAVNPINTGVLFLSLAGNYTNKERIKMSFKAFIVSLIVLLCVSLFGASLFENLGISLSAIRIAGGILMLKVGMQAIFEESTTAEERAAADFREENNTNSLERRSVVHKLPDISIFPLAVPIISGPGAISTSLVMMDLTNDFVLLKAGVLLALFINLLLTLIFMLSSNILNKILNKNVTQVLTRVLGLLICSLAIQFIIDGIKTSQIISL